MLNHLRHQALIWMIFCIMVPGIASAKGSGKAPAVVAPSWFGKVPSIQQPLEFHWLRQALEKSHDLRLQQAFEQAHLRFIEKKGSQRCSFIECGLQVHQEFEGTILYLFSVQKNGPESRQSLFFSHSSKNWFEIHRFCQGCLSEPNIGMLELAESFQSQARSVKPFPEVEETSQLVQHETEDYSKKQVSGSIASETLENKKPPRDLVKKFESNTQTKQVPKTQEPRIAEKKSEEKNIASTESITDKDGTLKTVRSLAMLKRTPEQENPLKLPEKPKPSQEVTKKRFSIDLLRFRLAQKKYNQLIWRDIKRSMMFFRQENGYRLESGLKAKVRLSIDETGKVIWKKLMHPSRSSVFNRRILESVNRLSLPPPVEILVQDPPYVVTILIEP
ncbi:MAG: hypothetical protein MK488_04800 [SAR324 cluster bacterium]|nr:hypothetical protein [SAR324 cluster bacterium]